MRYRLFFVLPFLLAVPASRALSQEVARLVVSPAAPVMIAGDTMRLSAQAFDAAGKLMEGVRIRFTAQGGRFEGTVDSLGLVQSGATGTLPVVAVAVMPGVRPKIEQFEVKMVAGPAASITPSHARLRLASGQRFRVTGEVFSRTNDLRAGDRISWKSSAPQVVRTDVDGMLTGLRAGSATLTGSVGDASVAIPVEVVAAQVASLELTPPHVEARQGDVLRFKVVARDAKGAPVPGLSTSWSFSPGEGVIQQDGAFTAYAPGEYVVTAAQGARLAQSVVRIAPREVRRPLTVVGRLPRTRFSTEEVWLHPNGKHAYLGSGSGGDVMVAIDISNPAKPLITDSIISNTRRVNDVMTTPDGKFLVFTREGASDRRNGIVICSLEDPAHPKVISEFTDGVTAGVHSAFVVQQEKYGTHIFLTNDGTGALHVIDINDPYKPKEVAQWRTPRAHGDAGRTLHDIDVQNGLLYASYWNDGLVILDVGNGMKGGSPSNPQLVSQYKYDLNFLYRDVEASGGPGFIRGTHTAWRHKNYVFIADEVFPASGVKGAKDASAGRAYGRMQVIDVSDIANPRSVAHYEPEFGGVHNLWVAGDTLYMGAYNGGFRAFDISGELRGDLRAQGREIGHLNTADMDGRVQNAAMTWGVAVKDGLAYVNDMYNGLWIVKIEPKPAVVP
ncbi:MAG: hypothetical protein ABIZ91_00035 [Gemmatimonadaceae bacterium]